MGTAVLGKVNVRWCTGANGEEAGLIVRPYAAELALCCVWNLHKTPMYSRVQANADAALGTPNHYNAVVYCV